MQLGCRPSDSSPIGTPRDHLFTSRYSTDARREPNSGAQIYKPALTVHFHYP